MNTFLTALLLIFVATHTHVVVAHAQDGTSIGNETVVADDRRLAGEITRPPGTLPGKADAIRKCAFDVDFAGNDIYNFQAAESWKCSNKCKHDTNCGAFTWTNYQGGTCWMKSRAQNLKVAMGAWTCAWHSLGRDLRVIKSCEMPGNDMKNVPLDYRNSDWCETICRGALPLRSPLLLATTVNQGRCLCKSKVSPCVNKPGAYTIVSFY